MREEYLDGTEVGPGYCRAIKQGNMIYVSGTGGRDKAGYLAPDAETQARVTYQKIESALTHFGADLSNVIRLCIYITDMKHAAEVSKVHAEVFGKFLPTSTLVAVSGLVANMVVEIEAQAIV